MQKNLTLGLLFGAILITGCSTITVPESTGGSRADGVVEMSFTYGAFQSPDIQWDSALIEATQRCKAWGYKSADRFGGMMNQCQDRGEYGCNTTLVTIKYQCLK